MESLVKNCHEILKENGSLFNLKLNLDKIDIELFNISNILNDSSIKNDEKINLIEKIVWEK